METSGRTLDHISAFIWGARTAVIVVGCMSASKDSTHVCSCTRKHTHIYAVIKLSTDFWNTRAHKYLNIATRAALCKTDCNIFAMKFCVWNYFCAENTTTYINKTDSTLWHNKWTLGPLSRKSEQLSTAGFWQDFNHRGKKAPLLIWGSVMTVWQMKNKQMKSKPVACSQWFASGATCEADDVVVATIAGQCLQWQLSFNGMFYISLVFC